MHPVSITISNFEFIKDKTDDVMSKNNSSKMQSPLKLNQGFQGTQTSDIVVNCSKKYLQSNLMTSHTSTTTSSKPITLSRPLAPVYNYYNDEKRDSAKKTPQEDGVLWQKRVKLYNLKLEAFKRSMPPKYPKRILKPKRVDDGKQDEKAKYQRVFRNQFHWSQADDAFLFAQMSELYRLDSYYEKMKLRERISQSLNRSKMACKMRFEILRNNSR